MAQITTIICTYRRPQLLARSLASLAAQTKRDFVVHVFDNASGDETPQVVDWFKQRGLPIQYRCHPENLGCLPNFAQALGSEIKTPFFHFLNDDDYVLPGFYENVMDGFLKMPDAILSAARTAHVNELNIVLDVPLARWERLAFPAGFGASYMLERGHPELTTIVFKTGWIGESGGFSPNAGSAFDIFFEVSAAARYPIIVSTVVGGAFQYHEDQLCFQNAAASTSFEKFFFENLDPSNFADDSSYRAALRATVRGHLASQRAANLLTTTIKREWNVFNALIGLCRAKPTYADQVIRAYGASLANFLRRRLNQGRETEERRNANKYFATISKQIGNVISALENDYIQPCFAETGVKTKALSARRQLES